MTAPQLRTLSLNDGRCQLLPHFCVRFGALVGRIRTPAAWSHWFAQGVEDDEDIVGYLLPCHSWQPTYNNS